jgi:hypothetical protein
MIRICSWCKKVIGEKEPLDDKSITHSICPECIKKEVPEVYEKIINKGGVN